MPPSVTLCLNLYFSYLLTAGTARCMMGIFKKVIDGNNDILDDLKYFRIYSEFPKNLYLAEWCTLLLSWQWFATLHFITSQRIVRKCLQCVWQRIFWSWAVKFWHSRTINSQLGCNVTPDTYTNRCLRSNFSSYCVCEAALFFFSEWTEFDSKRGQDWWAVFPAGTECSAAPVTH